MENKLITIGYLGGKSAYLNISKEEAIWRYCKKEWDEYCCKSVEQLVDEFDMELYKEFEFSDEFEVYDAW